MKTMENRTHGNLDSKAFLKFFDSDYKEIFNLIMENYNLSLEK